MDELTLDLPLDLPPATFTLAAGMVDEAGERLTVQGDLEDGLIFLDEIRVKPLTAGWLQPLRPRNGDARPLRRLVASAGLRSLARPGRPHPALC